MSVPTRLPGPTVQGVAGQTEGRFLFALLLTPPVVGTYGIELWAIDGSGDGNESNELNGSLEA